MKDKDRLTQIMLVTTVNRQRIRVYTKLRIEPKYWDKNTYRCVAHHPISFREKKKLAQLNKLNNRPRKRLGYLTPNEKFNSILTT